MKILTQKLFSFDQCVAIKSFLELHTLYVNNLPFWMADSFDIFFGKFIS
jgi:hypothetical protein